MTDRDHFAAAALTGLLTQSAYYSDAAIKAYEHADRMLRERGTAVSDNCVAGNQPEIACPSACVAQPEVQPICDRPVAGSTPAAGCAVATEVNMRDWVLGQGEFSPENTAKAYKEVADRIAKKACGAMERAVSHAFAAVAPSDDAENATISYYQWVRQNAEICGHPFHCPICGDATTHDAAPAAKAQLPEGVHASVGGGSDGTDKPVTRPAVGTGDIVTRLRQTRADMIGTEDEAHYWDCVEAVGEIANLRLAIRRLADQDGTLSVCEGAVIMTIDGTLTDEEREAIADAAGRYVEGITPKAQEYTATLRGLLERTK